MCNRCGNNPIEIDGKRVEFKTVDLPSLPPVGAAPIHDIASPAEVAALSVDDGVVHKFLPRTVPVPNVTPPQQQTSQDPWQAEQYWQQVQPNHNSN